MTATITLPPMLTRGQAAEYLGVSTRTLAGWACNGRYNLPFVKCGRSVRYRRADLDKWLADRTVTASNTQ